MLRDLVSMGKERIGGREREGERDLLIRLVDHVSQTGWRRFL